MTIGQAKEALSKILGITLAEDFFYNASDGP